MGLQKDGVAYNMAPIETHVRRLIWHQVCWLDLRCTEAQGPRPMIREDDYDTRLPDNIDDDQVPLVQGKTPQFENRWTDNTFALMRFEFSELHRFIWFERPKLERKQTSITAVL